MVRQNVFIKTFFITFVVFVIGLVLGLFIERYFQSDMTSRITSIESSVQEIDLEILYFQSLNDSSSCFVLNQIVRDTNNNLDSLAEQLGGYSEKNIIFTQNEIKDLKTKYTFLLIKDWILQGKIRKNCGMNSVSVLYFYDTKNCDDCIIQGNILSLLKNSFKEKLMVFPLDKNINLAMLRILLNKYNITNIPSVVINDEVYSGIVSEDNLKKILCSELTNATQCSK